MYLPLLLECVFSFFMFLLKSCILLQVLVMDFWSRQWCWVYDEEAKHFVVILNRQKTIYKLYAFSETIIDNPKNGILDFFNV